MQTQTARNDLTRRQRSRIASHFVCALAALLLATAIEAATVVVTVGDNSASFAPDDITIQAGDTVQWNWAPTSEFPHTVTSGAGGVGDGRFDTGFQLPPYSFSYTFQNPGTYEYFCRPHYSMGMIGFVRVTPAQSNPARLANISTRLRVETGDNALIAGFIITGTQPKKVIIRAVGPSLPLPGKLADPILQLFSGATLLESNDNWVDSSNKQAIIDSSLPPSNDLESAIVQTLPVNSSGYTAIMRGVNDGTGIGLVEVYDIGTGTDSKLANISTRGLVQTADNILIAGTIIQGSTTQKVIVRAIGPSLPLAGKLANPTLELRDSNGALLEANDNWIDSPNRQEITSTIPPANDFESAIIRTLTPAAYTAIVRGVNDTTGIAVVEVYALP